MNIEKLISPIDDRQPFIWFAKAEDDSILTEFEEDGKENEWNSINRKTLKEFGLFGRGVKLYYNINDGIIHIDNRTIEFYFEDENKSIIKLSGRNDIKYNDIVQFKHAYWDFDKKLGLQTHIIDAFHFGYKCAIPVKNSNIYFQFLFRMPMGQPIKLGFRFAPEFPLNLTGKLHVIIDGEEDENPTKILVPAKSSEVYERNFI
jgi:hypothetical protein